MVLGLAGCGTGSGTSTGEARAAQGVLRVLGTEYAEFVLLNGGRPPKEKGEFASYLESRKNSIRGLESVEQLFQSPRDNQPLVIFYGDSFPAGVSRGFPSVARESSGVNGQVFVVDTRGGVKELAIEQVPVHLASSN